MSIKRYPAEKEYEKDSNLSRESVEILLDWVRKQPHLPNITDEDIILFLSSCFYKIEKAKFTIDEYYSCRTHVPEFFAHRDPLEKLSDFAMKISCVLALPGTNDEGCKVFYCRLLDSDPSKFHFPTQVKCFFYHMDLALIERGSSKGVRIIIDLDTSSLGHITRINPLQLKKLVHYLQVAMPVRLQGVHFIHPVSFIDRLLSMIRPFLNKNVASVIAVHNSLADLHTIIPKKMLPSEAGGELPSASELYASGINKLLANRDWITSEEKMRVDESLRPGKARNAGEMFGVEGSFKKLDID